MSDTALGVSSTGGFFLWHCQDDFTLFGPKMDWRLATGDWRLAVHRAHGQNCSWGI